MSASHLELIQKIKAADSLQNDFLDHAVANLNGQEKSDFDRYIEYCAGTGVDLDFLCKSYLLLVQDTRKEQMYFRRHGKYRSSTYEQVKSLTYLNDDYMRQYMYGLAVSSCLWPNHTAISRWFIEKIPKSTAGRYLEVGPGHGFNMMIAMRHARYNSYEAVDISPTSVEMTESILESGLFGKFEHFKISVADFLKSDLKGPFAALVLGEVIEHVENPLDFMKRVKQLSTPDSFIFITTAINAPEIDHIYLFENVESVEKLVAQSGLVVKDKLALPYFGTTLARSVEDRLPINLALVLGHSK